MTREERHELSSAWIDALDWQYTFQRWGDSKKAAAWAATAETLKALLLSNANDCADSQ